MTISPLTSAAGLRTLPTPPADVLAELFGACSTIDPYPAYARMRREFPVANVYGDFVSVYRYADVAAVLRHPQASADDRVSRLHQSLADRGAFASAYLSQLDERSFLHRDPPEHTRLRALAAKALTAHRMQALRGFIQHHVDRAIDAAAPSGRMDVVADLAWPLPIEVICEVIGIPTEDRAFVASWPRTQLCCSFEPAGAAIRAGQHEGPRQVEADRIQAQLTDYFADLIERRRRGPGDDLVSALIAADDAAEALTVEEVNATLRLLLVAGYENAVNLIGHGTLALLRHLGQWDELREQPELAAGAVEEALRYDAPFQFTRRVAAADLEVGGYRIERGRHLILWLASANRDRAQFPDPDRFDIHRTGDRHLAFGSGIHACFGAPLARMQARIVFATLARRLVEPRLESETPRYRTDVFRSLADLPVTFSGSRAAS